MNRICYLPLLVVIYQMVASVNQIYKTEGICKMWIGMKPLVLLFRPDDVEVNEFVFMRPVHNKIVPGLGNS